MIQPVSINNRLIGPSQPCFIIAEAGVNHNGDIHIARRLIEAAAEAGADAIKFQSFVTEELVTNDAPKADYQVKTTGGPNSQFEMLKTLELSADEQMMLKSYCEKRNIIYLCTPYENKSIDMLDQMDVAAFKVASTDATNVPFLRNIAQKGRPVFLSTGMSTLGEVEQAIETLHTGGLDGKTVVLHCTSEYPAPANEVNLRAILSMQEAFDCPVGFSDHTSDAIVSSWAVAVGACVIEKHFTLDRNMIGPDHKASIEPDELLILVENIRNLEVAMGDGVKKVMPSELKNKSLMQKSLVARRNISAGDVIASDDLACKRPSFGLKPSWFDRVVGKRCTKKISKDEVLTLASIDWSE